MSYTLLHPTIFYELIINLSAKKYRNIPELFESIDEMIKGIVHRTQHYIKRFFQSKPAGTLRLEHLEHLEHLDGVREFIFSTIRNHICPLITLYQIENEEVFKKEVNDTLKSIEIEIHKNTIQKKFFEIFRSDDGMTKINHQLNGIKLI